MANLAFRFIFALVLGSVALAQANDPQRDYFTDTPLIGHDGRSYRFYTDLLAGKIVVIHSFFGACGDSCPIMLGKVAKLQEQFGDRLGKDLIFLSLSVDTVNDTPGRLKAVAESYKAGPGWLLLTGSKEQIDLVLGRLGQAARTRESHSTVFLMGRVASRHWKKVHASATVGELGKNLRELLLQE